MQIVKFNFESPRARTAALVGDFNAWDPSFDPMIQTSTGKFSLEKKFPVGGRYRYKILTDGRYWISDPNCLITESDGFGGINSILEIEHQASEFDTMNEFCRRLENAPPQWESSHERKEILLEMDAIFLNPDAAQNDDLNRIYTVQVNEMITQIRYHRIRKGIRVWYLYNHGFFIETPNVLFAIDFITAKSAWGVFWHFPATLVRQLADMVDFALVSHRHSDHMDFEWVGRLQRRNKAILMPSTLSEWFEGRTIGMRPDEKKKIFDIEIKAHQGVHVYDGGRGIPIRYWEIRLENNFNILHTSDHDYTAGIKADRKIDLLIPKFGGVSPMVHGEKALHDLFDTLHPSYCLPGHILELGHPVGGGRKVYRDVFGMLPENTPKFEALFWGEGIQIQTESP